MYCVRWFERERICGQTCARWLARSNSHWYFLFSPLLHWALLLLLLLLLLRNDRAGLLTVWNMSYVHYTAHTHSRAREQRRNHSIKAYVCGMVYLCAVSLTRTHGMRWAVHGKWVSCGLSVHVCVYACLLLLFPSLRLYVCWLPCKEVLLFGLLWLAGWLAKRACTQVSRFMFVMPPHIWMYDVWCVYVCIGIETRMHLHSYAQFFSRSFKA